MNSPAGTPSTQLTGPEQDVGDLHDITVEEAVGNFAEQQAPY
jgi:hypothetical protein